MPGGQPQVQNSTHHLLQQQQQQQQQQQHLQLQQSQQQHLQLQASTLINSNHHVMVGPAPPTGMPLGAPPTPTVKSIAKQMNITIPGGGGVNPGSPTFSTMGMVAAQKAAASAGGTPLQLRKQLPNPHLHHPYGSMGVVGQSPLILQQQQLHPPPIHSIEQLMLFMKTLGLRSVLPSRLKGRVSLRTHLYWELVEM